MSKCASSTPTPPPCLSWGSGTGYKPARLARPQPLSSEMEEVSSAKRVIVARQQRWPVCAAGQPPRGREWAEAKASRAAQEGGTEPRGSTEPEIRWSWRTGLESQDTVPLRPE